MRCSNSRLSCDPNQIIGIQFPNESHSEGRVYVMKKRIVYGLEVRRSSGNVYADLGLLNAEKLKIKTGLVIEIRKAIRRLELTQQVAAKRMGLTQPKVSDMMRGDFTNLPEPPRLRHRDQGETSVQGPRTSDVGSSVMQRPQKALVRLSRKSLGI